MKDPSENEESVRESNILSPTPPFNINPPFNWKVDEYVWRQILINQKVCYRLNSKSRFTNWECRRRRAKERRTKLQSMPAQTEKHVSHSARISTSLVETREKMIRYLFICRLKATTIGSQQERIISNMVSFIVIEQIVQIALAYVLEDRTASAAE
jgi:hypothetical protein